MKPDTIGQITTILAVGVVVLPVGFGYVLWRLAKIFVRISTFDEYRLSTERERAELKATAERERLEIRTTLNRIEENLTRVAISVARLEGRRNDGRTIQS